MSRDVAGKSRFCPECGAENFAHLERCWMCQGDLRNVVPVEIVPAQLVAAQPKFVPSGRFFLLLTVLAIALAIVVGWGLGSMSFGFLPWYALVAIPALLATAIRVGRKRRRGEKVAWTEAILTVVVSGAIVYGALVLVILAIVVALFVMCLISPPNFGH